MRRGGLGIVALVALVVLTARCPGFEFDSPDATHPDTTMPSGLGDEVTKVTALVAAHERSLNGMGVVTERGRVTAMSATLVTVETNRWGRHVESQSFKYRVVRTGGVPLSEPDWLTETPQQEGANG